MKINPDKPLNAFDTINKFNPKDKEILLSILHNMGLDYSYTVTNDEIGMKYIQKIKDVTEEDILRELLSYISKNPQVYFDFEKI